MIKPRKEDKKGNFFDKSQVRRNSQTQVYTEHTFTAFAIFVIILLDSGSIEKGIKIRN